MNNIGENILGLAKVKGISQATIAKALGISKSTVSKWGSGGKLPTMDQLIPLCNVLHCYPSEILGTNKSYSLLVDNDHEYDLIMVDKNTTEGKIIEKYLDLPGRKQACVEGYINSLMEDGFTRR